jgi:hypothetical protein
MPPRISLASLIGIVAVIALGLAGMLSASRLWLTLASTVTLALLLAALLASWLFSGKDRAFWVGFALFGWTHLIMANWGWVGGQIGGDLTVGISDAAEWLLPEVQGPPTMVYGAPSPNPFAPVEPSAPSALVDPVDYKKLSQQRLARIMRAPPVLVNPVDYMELSRQRQIKIGNFVQIGGMLCALCFGVLGGWLGRALAERAERSTQAERPASPG